MNVESVRQSLYSGIWGTIGPKFEEACAMFGKRQGAYACLMHSATAAYEAALRSLGIAHGDRVLCAAYSHRMDAEVAAAIGAAPVFVDISAQNLLPSAESVQEALEHFCGIRALVVDYSEKLDLSALKRICKEASCALILNAGDALDAAFDYEGIYAAVFDFGICGVLTTGSKENYVSFFGWHHCGHAPGTTESFSFDQILGGDMRVSEWQAIEALEILKEAHPERPVKERGYISACENPVFRTAYFRKVTGFTGEYDTERYPNALAAAGGK